MWLSWYCIYNGRTLYLVSLDISMSKFHSKKSKFFHVFCKKKFVIDQIDQFYEVKMQEEIGIQQVSEEFAKEIEERVIEACKNDLGHMQNLCVNDGDL